MSSRSQSGFTLIELMIVVAIMALMVQVVMVNMGALIPSSALDSVAAKIQSQLDFIRSEAKIQGKPYALEIDLDNSRCRLVIPQEEMLVSSQTAVDGSGLELRWKPLDDDGWVVNGLAVRPGRVIMPPGISNRTLDQLTKLNIEIITLPYDKMALNGGGIHCSTCPLIRDTV